MKKMTALLIALLLLGLTACGAPASPAQTETVGAAPASEEPTTLVYASGDYTRINPAMDEHGEINILLFNGLTAHNGKNEVVPGLAKSWEYDDET